MIQKDNCINTPENTPSENLAIVVVSCDAYSDVWKPFFSLFFKYWDHCPYPVYLLSNYLRYDDNRVKTISIGQDKDWSSNLTNALSRLNEKYILLCLEDFFISRSVDTNQIEILLQYLIKRHAACLRLFPNPGPNKQSTDNPTVGEIVKGSPYRASTQIAIWDKSMLLDLIQNGETAWEFELEGTKRTDALEYPFLSVNDDNIPIQYLSSAIIRGKWNLELPDFCRKEGITIDFNQRGYWRWYSRYFTIFTVLSRKTRKFSRNVVKGIK